MSCRQHGEYNKAILGASPGTQTDTGRSSNNHHHQTLLYLDQCRPETGLKGQRINLDVTTETTHVSGTVFPLSERVRVFAEVVKYGCLAI